MSPGEGGSAGAPLEGRTAVVTGGSGGIGRAVSLRLARHGARVVVGYHSSEGAARETVRAIEDAGGEAVAVREDVSTADGAARLLRAVEDTAGPPDVWANVAGADILTGEASRLDAVEKAERVLSVDLRGTIHCSRLAGRAMKEAGGGVIVNMSWDQVHGGLRTSTTDGQMYAAAKGGVAAFSRSLARSLAPEVRVNVVAPGWIETAFAREEMPEEAYREVVEETPLGRFGRPEDVAGAVLWLVSDDASFVTGQTLVVNGGYAM